MYACTKGLGLLFVIWYDRWAAPHSYFCLVLGSCFSWPVTLGFYTILVSLSWLRTAILT